MMLVNYITFFATFASLCSYAVDAASLKIIGGQDADIKDYPYMASIRWVDNDIIGADVVCGASIIDENTVLTAAHCVDREDAEGLGVVYGNTNQSVMEFQTRVSKIIIHEKYIAGRSWPNDIALLKVNPPLVITETSKPVKLSRTNTPNPQNLTATLIGWGSLDKGNIYPDVLQKLDVVIAYDKLCKQTWHRLSSIDLYMDSQLCAAPDTSDDDESMRGPCVADGGDPLVIDGVQFGVSSFNFRYCGNLEVPSVYTRVSFYIDWISSHL